MRANEWQLHWIHFSQREPELSTTVGQARIKTRHLEGTPPVPELFLRQPWLESSFPRLEKEFSVFKQQGGRQSCDKCGFIKPDPNKFMSCPVFPSRIRPLASTQHYSNPSYSFVCPFPSCCVSSLLRPSFLSDVESAAVHSKQQVMDLARDLSWLWMSQPVGVRVGVQMDSEKPARKTHTLSLWDFSLSLFLSCKSSTSVLSPQSSSHPPLSSKTGTNQRGSGVSLVAQDASSLIPAV